MKAVSFIGINEYDVCTYVFEGEQFKTHLFPHALSCFFDLSELIIFVTKESANAPLGQYLYDEKNKLLRDAYLRGCEESHGLTAGSLADKTYFEQVGIANAKRGLIKPKKTLIKSGQNEEELWDIFNTISDSLEENDEVVFDITHAFRSIPFLALLVIGFLRKTKKIRVHKVVYGAFDARDTETNIAPVFDLTPFVELFDWISATDHFDSTGNASSLVALLTEDKKLAENIDNLSKSLRLLRPLGITKESSRLTNTLQNEQAIAHVKSIPVTQLLTSMLDNFSTLALKNPSNKKNKTAFVERLFEIADWYFQKGLHVQSIAVIREIIPTIVCVKLGLAVFDRDERLKAERFLNYREGDKAVYAWSKTTLPNTLKDVWDSISPIRNDVLHAGFNQSSRKVGSVIDQNREILKKLKELRNEVVSSLNMGVLLNEEIPIQPMITLLNSPVVTSYGKFDFQPLSLEEAKASVTHAPEVVSAIGHESTAEIMTELLGIEVKVNRIRFEQQPGESAIIFRLNSRPPAGAVLDRDEIEKLGYVFGLLTRSE